MSDERFDDRQFWLPALYQEQWVPMVRLVALLISPAHPDLAGAELLVRDELVVMYRDDPTFHSWDHVVSALRANVTTAARGVHLDDAATRNQAQHAKDAGRTGEPARPGDPEGPPQVLWALAGLPHRLRDVLVIKLYAGTRLAETADALGATRKVVHRRRDRALAELCRICDRSDGDELEEALQEQLRQAGDRLQPGDFRAEVLDLARSARQRRSHWGQRLFVVLVLVAALAAGYGLSWLWTMPGDQADPSSSGAVTAGGQAPEPSGSTVISTQNGVEVFYLGRSDGLLYREIRNLPNVGDRLNTAITAVLSVAPLDPEYTSSWSGGQVNGATVDGDRITLDLSQSAFAGFHSQHQEEAAIQQLVYAATAAVDNGQNRWVRILVDGSPNLPLIGKPQADFKRGGANILGPMWVDSPLAGATESSGTLNISGLVRSSLPAPGWQLYSVSQQRVVARGTVATGSQSGPWTSWQQKVPLPETGGEYQVILVIGQQQAIKTITVR